MAGIELPEVVGKSSLLPGKPSELASGLLPHT